MGSIVNNNFNRNTEIEAMQVLSHFNTEQIMDIVYDSLNRRIIAGEIPMPNIVNLLDVDFTNTANEYPDAIEEIEQTKEDTYNTIIDLLAGTHNLAITKSDSLMTSAFYLYDFFISNYKNYLIRFFANYIYNQKNELYNALNLEELKKNKDTSTTYCKKMYKSNKLAVILANIELVIDTICTIDIPKDYVLHCVYQDPAIRDFMNNTIQENQDLFKIVYLPLIMSPELRQSLIGSIRLTLHKYAVEA